MTATASAELAPLTRGLASLLNPPSKLKISEWAERHRVLAREASAEPGLWSNARTPYLVEPMDVAVDRRVHTVTLMFGAQMGKTEVVLNVLGRYAHLEPVPMLVLQPNERPMAESFSKDRLAPMIRESDALRRVFSSPKSRDSANTILHKGFKGGHVTMVGANSPAGLATRPICVTLSDEIDRHPVSAGGEGDPLTLAEKRTTTFGHRKKRYRLSTPTVKGLSRIEASYLEGDQREYFVPCPHCAELQVLTWAGIRWTDNDPETAAYYCCECGAEIPESMKAGMVARGRWIAGAPFNGHASFHASALISPFVRWPEVVREFLEAKADPQRLQVWVNTVLGEPWEEDGDVMDSGTLLARREEYNAEVPGRVAVLTAAVDIQDDRLEVFVWGWGRGEECWLIRHEYLYGDPGLDEPWESAEAVLGDIYQHESGARLKVAATAVDTGGHHTDRAYSWVRERHARRVWAIKGVGGEGKPILGRISKANRWKVKLLPVGVHAAKDTLHSRLRMTEAGPGYVHLPEWADEELVAQLVSEKRVTKYRNGRPYREWVKTRNRNEALDGWNYGYAALLTLGPAVVGRLGTLVDKLWSSADDDDDDDRTTSSSSSTSRRTRTRRRRSGWVQKWRR